MVRRFIQNVNGRFESLMRDLFGRMTPEKRMIAAVTMLLLFGSLSIYMTLSSIVNFGKARGMQMQIERIEAPKLLQQEEIRTDTVNLLNDFYHGKDESN